MMWNKKGWHLNFTTMSWFKSYCKLSTICAKHAKSQKKHCDSKRCTLTLSILFCNIQRYCDRHPNILPVLSTKIKPMFSPSRDRKRNATLLYGKKGGHNDFINFLNTIVSMNSQMLSLTWLWLNEKYEYEWMNCIVLYFICIVLPHKLKISTVRVVLSPTADDSEHHRNDDSAQHVCKHPHSLQPQQHCSYMLWRPQGSTPQLPTKMQRIHRF